MLPRISSLGSAPGPVRGIAWALAAALCFLTSAVLVRLLGEHLPSLEIAVFRTTAGLFLVAVAWKSLRDLRDPWVHLLRGALGGVGIICLVHAYASGTPLALVAVIYYSRVAIIMVAGRLVLGEQIGSGLWAAAVLAAIGVLIALYPQLSGTLDVGAVAALAAAVTSAGSQVCIRRLAMTNQPSTIVVVFAVICSLILAGPATAVWVPPHAIDIPLLVGIGVGAAAAQYFAAQAYRAAPASYLAPVNFLEVPLAAAVGYLVFGEVIDAFTGVGATMVLGASVYLASLSRQYE
jgi:drug/metabolite transporter (DMT)-like permease